MAARRRNVPYQALTNNNVRPGQHHDDSDDDCPQCKPDAIDPKILAVYDESDDDDEYGPTFNEQERQPMRKRISTTMAYLILFTVMGVLIFYANLRSNRQLAKLKANMGYDHRPVSKAWWNSAVIYYLNPRSFQDSDDDGVGDLRGIMGRIDHLEALAVDAVLLRSPLSIDSTGGVTNFTNIDPVLGDMHVFHSVVHQLHKRQIKVILDLEINHSSEDHPWFQASRLLENNHFSDFYVWNEGTTDQAGVRHPPNNWLSRVDGSAWTWDDQRQAFYLHQLDAKKPDLNHRHLQVTQELLHAAEFWSQTGIDGISLHDVNLLFEVEDIQLNEPAADQMEEDDPDAPDLGRATRRKKHVGEYASLDHIYTDDQPEIHEYMANWREFVDKRVKDHDDMNKLLLIVEVNGESMADVRHFYNTGCDMPTMPFLSQLKPDCDAYCLHEFIDEWVVELPDGKRTLWSLGMGAEPGAVSWHGEARAKALTVLQYTLPGAVLLRQGDELAITRQDGQEPIMVWDDTKTGGFSNTAQHTKPNTSRNAKTQLSDENSMLSTHAKLGKLRRSVPALRDGAIKYTFTNKHVLSFIRFISGETPCLIMVNVGDVSSTDDYSLHVGMLEGRILLYIGDGSESVAYTQNQQIQIDNVTLQPGAALVIQLT